MATPVDHKEIAFEDAIEHHLANEAGYEKRRALVHFAVDPDEVSMTTRLDGKSTRFLPFNLGDNHGAGNPPNPHGYRSAYLWEKVWQRDSWLDILARFIHLEVEEKQAGGRRVRKETMIFPRYHQFLHAHSTQDRRPRQGDGGDRFPAARRAVQAGVR